MNVREAARRLEVLAWMVYAVCAEGRLPHLRVGLGRGTIRIGEEDLKTSLEGCRPQRPPRSTLNPEEAAARARQAFLEEAGGQWRPSMLREREG